MPTVALGYRPATPPSETIPDAGDLAAYDPERRMLVMPSGEALIDTDLTYHAGTATTNYPDPNKPGRHFIYDDSES